jgi:hypothetical protein
MKEFKYLKKFEKFAPLEIEGVEQKVDPKAKETTSYKISEFLNKNSKVEWTDFDFNGKILLVYVDSDIKEKFSREELEAAGVL